MFRRVLMAAGLSAGVAYTTCAAPEPALAEGKLPPLGVTKGLPAAHQKLPVEKAILGFAPNVPPPITRRTPALIKVDMTFETTTMPLTRKYKYDFWTICGSCPGPMIRTRVGDVIQVTVKNNDTSGMPHNIDFHSVMGPGGGAPLLLADQGKSKTAHFKMMVPGLYVYHCAAAPIPLHINNGMYGLILVEPEGGLPAVDKEYYIMQSEFYVEPPEKGSNVATAAYDMGLREDAEVVVFNGREGSLTDKEYLSCKVNDRVRMYVGNGGPNLISSFHAIGAIFDKLYREGDLISPPARGVQTTLIPPGGAAVVEMVPETPGTLTLVDHALFRLDKGCVGFLQVHGEPNPEIYHSIDNPNACIGCKVHP